MEVRHSEILGESVPYVLTEFEILIVPKRIVIIETFAMWRNS